MRFPRAFSPAMTQGLSLRLTATGVRMDVRVMPRSPRTAIEGVRDGRLLIRVTAPPVDQAANVAVQETLARALNLTRGQVRIAGGLTTRNKVVELTGTSEAVVRAALGTLLRCG